MAGQLIESIAIQTKIWSDISMLDERLSSRAENRRSEQFLDFIAANPLAAERDHLPGHLTGSALICSPDFTQVLLTHHRKLNLWLQLGGHADGEWDVGNVALREVAEESGLTRFQPVQFRHQGAALFVPYDLDCHEIPPYGNSPGHLHFDVRYIVVAEPSSEIKVSEESHDVRWFSLEEARTLTEESSMHRQFDKIEILRTLPKYFEIADSEALINRWI